MTRHRKVATAVTLLGGVGFVALAFFLVPWNPVPGGWPEPVDPRSVFTPEQIERGEDYAQWSRIIAWSALLVSLAVACWLGFTTRGAHLLGSGTGRWPARTVGLVALVLLIGELVTLPFSAALQVRRIDYGLTEQPWTGWAVDQAKNYALSVVAFSIVLLVLVGCARRWRTWWPAVAGSVCASLVLLGSFAYPVVVEPLFNDFESMADGPLRTEILRLADAEGVSVDDVLVADASRRTTTLNAYVSGFGSTRRIVVYDNLVDSQLDDEVISVVAHELAHAKHDDVLVGTVLGAFGTLFAIGLLALVTSSGRIRRRSGVAGLHDPRSVALVLALLAVATLVSSPVQNSISRHVEMRADVDALRVSSPEAMVELQRQLCLRSVCEPTPPAWSHFWFGSHPGVLERVALAGSRSEAGR